MASLPSNIDKDVPVVGFIAHLDTSPDMSGRHVSPRIVKNYDGKDIVLCAEEDIVLKPSEFPELHHYIGQDLIVTNGKTLLGADDKAGIAEIVTAMEYLLKHPANSVPRGCGLIYYFLSALNMARYALHSILTRR